MNDQEIIQLWKSNDEKLESAIRMNRENTIRYLQLKATSLTASMKPLKLFTIATGILWVLFLDSLVIALFSTASPYFLISAILMTLLNKIAIGLYLYQLVLIHRLDRNAPVLQAQSRLSRLKSSTLLVSRILLLQLPLWTTFYLQQEMFNMGNLPLLTLQALVTFSFLWLALWLFFNIKYENREKKWFRLLFRGREWDPIMNSIDLYKEVEEYGEST